MPRKMDDEPSSFRALSPGQIPDMRMLKNIRGERFYLGTITLGLSDSESSSDESSSFSSHRLPCQLPVAKRGHPQMNHGKINELEHLVEDLRKTIRELQLKNISLSNLVEKLQHVETRKKAEIKNLKMEVQTLKEAACNGACHRRLDRKRVENSRERVIKRGEEREMYSDEMYTERKVDKRTKQNIDKRQIVMDSLREKENETRREVEERDNMKRQRDKLQCEIKGLKSELLEMKREKVQEIYEKDRIKARQDEVKNTTESQCRAGKSREVLGRGEMERRMKEQSLEKQRKDETQREMERREEELMQREARRQKERQKALDTEREALEGREELERAREDARQKQDHQKELERQKKLDGKAKQEMEGAREKEALKREVEEMQRQEKERERQRELERESEAARQKEDLRREIERLEEKTRRRNVVSGDSSGRK
ncbi:vicilin-like seed storage protein At2g18540 isoform X2 [Hypomesus transpacificus]|uniref:vicilin-like seed storage protein At2g18540 isoform X2 n=1 Tax=Hypomesus transpacificus TaxID=137520 RepID=UPI001F077691|nr:vicilin-like seed storage protein At2g18540 isoform X2 [Hypomesus transpacificus]